MDLQFTDRLDLAHLLQVLKTEIVRLKCIQN